MNSSALTKVRVSTRAAVKRAPQMRGLFQCGPPTAKLLMQRYGGVHVVALAALLEIWMSRAETWVCGVLLLVTAHRHGEVLFQLRVYFFFWVHPFVFRPFTFPFHFANHNQHGSRARRGDGCPASQCCGQRTHDRERWHCREPEHSKEAGAQRRSKDGWGDRKSVV